MGYPCDTRYHYHVLRGSGDCGDACGNRNWNGLGIFAFVDGAQCWLTRSRSSEHVEADRAIESRIIQVRFYLYAWFDANYCSGGVLVKLLDRGLLLLTGLLAAYQIVVGVKGADTFAGIGYTVSFGIVLVAGLLLIIFGIEVLASPIVVVVAALIPLGLALGLVAHFFPILDIFAFVIGSIGWFAILLTRFGQPGKFATIVLAMVHSVAGLLICGLPIVLWLRDIEPAGFVFISVGGALIGLGGLLLSFLKTGKPILSEKLILTLLPGLLLLMMAAFVAGFAAL